MLELSRTAPAFAETCQKRPVRREFLYPVIVKIGDEDIALRADGDTRRDREPAVEWTRRCSSRTDAPFMGERAVWLERLNPITIAVRDEDRAVSADRDVRRIVELPADTPDLAGRAPLPDGLAVGGQLLNALIVEVGDDKRTVRPDRHATGRIVLSRSASGGSNNSLRRAVVRKNLHPVVKVFRHIEFAVMGGEVHRTAQLARSLSPAVQRSGENFQPYRTPEYAIPESATYTSFAATATPVGSLNAPGIDPFVPQAAANS